MNESDSAVAPEFSRFVDCGKLRSELKTYEFEASDQEREALAKRFSVDSLDSLSARFSLRLGAGGVVELSGQLQASVHQTCVITLKPVIGNIDITVERTYSSTAKPYWGKEDEPDEDGRGQNDDDTEPPEPLVDGGIDLGEVASEELAIEIDPFPRIADAELPPKIVENEADHDETAKNPFAVLEKLKKKLK